MAVVDTEAIDEGEAQTLRDLVAQAGLDRPSGLASSDSPDAESWRLVIEDAGATREYLVRDAEASPAVRALLRFLDDRATFRKRER